LALASALLGLGFTFFSGAVQAWLVDALKAHSYDGALDPVFARGEIVEGVAMLGGSVLGGHLAQATNLGVPYVLRAAALALSFVTACLLMHDLGFTPKPDGGALRQAKAVLRSAIHYGFASPPVRRSARASRGRRPDRAIRKPVQLLGTRDEVWRKWRLANSRPDPLFKYRSNSSAGSSSSNAMTTSIRQGRNSAGCGERPWLWAISRASGSDVRPV
jgi:hypothetical protein